jgi:hypothetical protein
VSDDETSVASILWSEAQRLLVRQEAGFDTLRTQAVALLSVASIVAGLFGSHIRPNDHSIQMKVAAALLSAAMFSPHISSRIGAPISPSLK